MAKRPLRDRLYDLQHALKIDGWTHFEKDVAEAIQELDRLGKLLASVDVKVDAAPPKG